MKRLITLIAISVCISAYAEKIKVKESKEDIGGGNNSALVITLYGINPSDAEDEFKDFMKQFDGKRSGKDGGVFIDNATIKQISGSNTIDVYGKALGKKGDPDILFVVAFDLDGTFLSSSEHVSQFKTAEKITREFAVKVTKDVIAGELKTAQKTQRNLENNQKDLERDNQDLHNDIEKYKEKIKKAEADLVINQTNQTAKKLQIEAQKKLVTDIDAKLKAVE